LAQLGNFPACALMFTVFSTQHVVYAPQLRCAQDELSASQVSRLMKKLLAVVQPPQ
jgi:hypothetical protein